MELPNEEALEEVRKELEEIGISLKQTPGELTFILPSGKELSIRLEGDSDSNSAYPWVVVSADDEVIWRA